MPVNKKKFYENIKIRSYYFYFQRSKYQRNQIEVDRDFVRFFLK